jgi:hypothetical protein
MKGIAKSTATFLMIGASFWCGCGGKADADAQSTHTGGNSSGPSAHISDCEDLCSRSADAGCLAPDTTCVMSCATVTGFSECQKQIDAWIACAKEASVSCDSNGLPVFDGCDTKLAIVAACASTVAPPKEVSVPCGGFCDQIEAAGCSAATPLGDCRTSCGAAGLMVAACQSSYVKYLDCIVASGAGCGANGQLNTSICTAQQMVYTGCMLTEVGTATLLTGTGGTTAQ